jgi:non-ribosomal peptide synthetase component F
MQGEVLEQELEYWRKQLEGAAELRIAGDHERGRGRSYRSGTHFFSLDPALSRGVRELARAEAVTPAILSVAALQLVLHHLTHQTDVVIGADVANRTPRDVEPLIGYFINQVVLRSDISGNPSFQDFLSRVRRTCIQAYTRQDVPFDRVVETLRPLRTADSHPFFRIKIGYNNVPASLVSVPGLKIEDYYVPMRATNLDLTMLIGDSEDSIQGRIEYRLVRFTSDLVRRIAASFVHVLGVAVRDVHRTLAEYKSDLDKLDATARERGRQAREDKNTARLVSLQRH